MRAKYFIRWQKKAVAIQSILDNLHIKPVLCHGDACVTSNYLRLKKDGTIRLIDWEQAGMADPILDIAILSINQGMEQYDPELILIQYLQRKPSETELLRLHAYMALYGFAFIAWDIATGQDISEGVLFATLAGLEEFW